MDVQSTPSAAAAAPAREETKDAFEKRMQQTVLSGYSLIGISLGVELGLFKAFESLQDQVTSSQLAEKANCKERYVREWLHHMAMCDVVDVDVTGTRFSLPQHRRETLTDDAQLVTGVGSVIPHVVGPHADVVDCFQRDGPPGLPFEKVLPAFAMLTRKTPRNLHICADFLRDKVPGLQDQLNAGIRVCEVGVGRGVMLFHLASQFSGSHFVGLDLSQSLLSEARGLLAAETLPNVELHLMDATQMPTEWSASFDYVVLRDVLHDIAHVDTALSAFYRCLKPGGRLSLLEMNMSSNPYTSRENPEQKARGQMLYAMSMYHCLPASLNVPGSQGLGAAVGVERIEELVREAGFVVSSPPERVEFANVHILAEKPSDKD